MKQKIKKFIRWILDECKDRKTIIIFCVVVVLMYAPVWGGYLLYGLTQWNWCLIVASSYLAFWAGPFTPYFPLCLTITLAIKRIIEKRKDDV